MRFLIILVLFCGLTQDSFAQVKPQSGLDFLSREWNKAENLYRGKNYVITKVLDLPQDQVTPVTISAITSSKSGELTTMVYDCEKLAQRGVVFVFWNPYYNPLAEDVHYLRYGYRNIEASDFEELAESLLELLEDKKGILKEDNNVVYTWQDIDFVFSNDQGRKSIRVIFGKYDSEWNDANLKTTIKRFRKFEKKQDK
jgi:hypothetical protein